MCSSTSVVAPRMQRVADQRAARAACRRSAARAACCAPAIACVVRAGCALQRRPSWRSSCGLVAALASASSTTRSAACRQLQPAQDRRLQQLRAWSSSARSPGCGRAAAALRSGAGPLARHARAQQQRAPARSGNSLLGLGVRSAAARDALLGQLGARAASSRASARARPRAAASCLARRSAGSSAPVVAQVAASSASASASSGLFCRGLLERGERRRPARPAA